MVIMNSSSFNLTEGIRRQLPNGPARDMAARASLLAEKGTHED
jgi:hypothetical protein